MEILWYLIMICDELITMHHGMEVYGMMSHKTLISIYNMRMVIDMVSIIVIIASICSQVQQILEQDRQLIRIHYRDVSLSDEVERSILLRRYQVLQEMGIY